MIRQARRWLRISPRERRLLTKAWGLFILIYLYLTFRSWRDAERRIMALHHGMRPTTTTMDRQEAEHLMSWALDVAGRYLPWRPSCLHRAIAGRALMQSLGHDATLRIGVGRDERRQFIAHAWLECDGRILIGDGPEMETLTAMPPVWN